MQIKNIRRYNHSSQNNIQVKNIASVSDWLTTTIDSKSLFASIRWYANPPTTDKQLISRLHNVFNKLFQELLGSHWFKTYKNHFNLVVVKELGKSHTNYHSHIALGIKSNKFTIDDVINAFIKVQDKVKAVVYVKTDAEEVKLPDIYPDNIVISPVYYVGGISEYITKEFNITQNETMSFASADNLIFDYQIFN